MADPAAAEPKKWQKGKGWGWVWGADDEVGALMIGSDTWGLEMNAPPPEGSTSFMPVHNYLLIEQGVYISEFHYLEDLAREQVYEFLYVATTNKIKGAAAGFTMRPLAIY